ENCRETHHDAEVGDDKVGIMHLNIKSSICENDSRQSSCYECGDQTNGKQHCRSKDDIPLPQGSDIVKCFYCRWNSDKKCCKHKYRTEEWIHTRNKHVVSPNNKRKETNSEK